MATKAETFKSNAQRTGAARPAPRKKPAARTGPPHDAAARAEKIGPYELEVSVGRASRKSTRRSPTHIKTDAALRLTAVERNRAPRARAARGRRARRRCPAHGR